MSRKKLQTQEQIEDLLDTFDGNLSDLEGLSDNDDDELAPSDVETPTTEEESASESEEVPLTAGLPPSQPSTSQKLAASQRVRNAWRKPRTPFFFRSEWLEDQPLRAPEFSLSPLQYFRRYIPDSMYQVMADNTNLYAVRTTGKSLDATSGEMRKLIGIHIHMGSLQFAQCRMYWNNATRIDLIASAMSFNRFSKLRNNLHVVDNDTHDANSSDRTWKVKPLLDSVLQRCKSVPMLETLSGDEQIIPFKGRNVMKQYVRGKPEPWGFKIFVLCSSDGMVHNFIFYQGAGTTISDKYKNYGLGTSVILSLADGVIPQHKNYKLFFDNFFSSITLFRELKALGILAAGTVRKNRLESCPLVTDKVLQERGRGSMDSAVTRDGEIVAVKWMDNSSVILFSTFVGIGEIDKVKRWDKKTKAHILVERPEVVQCYNKFMGGVDKCDHLLSLYRIFIKSRKWTLRVLFHFIDVAVVNSWLEYIRACDAENVPRKRRLQLLQFRLELAEALVVGVTPAQQTRKRGRPSKEDDLEEEQPQPHRNALASRPVEEVRYDNVGHFPDMADSNTREKRCRMKFCNMRSKVICVKCQVNLCFNTNRNCFRQFHLK